jgi:hypothetical protein
VAQDRASAVRLRILLALVVAVLGVAALAAAGGYTALLK